MADREHLAALLAAYVDGVPLKREEYQLLQQMLERDATLRQEFQQALFVHHHFQQYQEKFRRNVRSSSLTAAAAAEPLRTALWMRIFRVLKRQRIALVTLLVAVALGYLGVRKLGGADLFHPESSIVVRKHLVSGLEMIQQQKVSLDVQSADPQSVLQWANRRAPALPQEPPPLAATLVGAKLVQLMDRAFLCWVYRRDSAWILVTQFPADMVTDGYVFLDRQMRYVLGQGKRYVEKIDDGKHLFVWQDKNVVYALIASMDRAAIIKLITK